MSWPRKRRRSVHLPLRPYKYLMACVVTTGLVSAALAQTGLTSSDLTRIRGSEDGDVSIPKLILPLGRKDASALQEVISFLKKVNGAAWNGMQATGSLTSSNGRSPEQSAAILTMESGDSIRLDVDSAEGKRSIRIKGSTGQIVESNGNKHYLPVATARAGYIVFPKLMTATFPTEQTSIIDGSLTTIDGKQLHRITIEEPAFAGETSSSPDQISTTDLYFDPATDLLIKSVSSIQIDSADRQRYLQVVTYSDYRLVDDALLLPFAYVQTLNGQRQWAFQATSIQLQPSISASYFSF
jgi:hypothetical protein